MVGCVPGGTPKKGTAVARTSWAWLTWALGLVEIVSVGVDGVGGPIATD